MTEDNDVMAYIGRKSCGCVVAATVDEPQYAKDTAKFVAQMIKEGLAVERVTVEYARANLNFNCQHGKAKARL